MATSGSYERLSSGVQRWIYRQGWPTLRPVQEWAIPAIMGKDRDVLITAPTAGGKTEAAFLPIVSAIESEGETGSYQAICISPLKALINDQSERLELLCEMAGTQITPWHGDVATSRKRNSWAKPAGILLITPESFESLFINRAEELKSKVSALSFVVIDEFHAFVGRERGKQLLSLLSRLERLLGKTLPRTALSATIGNPQIALAALRPASNFLSQHLSSDGEHLDLRLGVKTMPTLDSDEIGFLDKASDELFDRLRGESHLVFANTRANVEGLADKLRTLSEHHFVPNEFFPHHGSLSRDARHEVESRLRQGRQPTTAIATSTLELGIDIGTVVSVAQVGAPGNVSSLRQRLGRSGRREGDPAQLRIIIEGAADRKTPDPIDRLELGLIQTIAAVELLFENFLEPPEARRLELSTMVQQVLSMIAYRGDVRALDAFETLCRTGPWRNVDEKLFARVLRAMAAADLIQQLPSGELIVGPEGERLVGHYSFCTAFQTPEEYRLEANGRTLGTLPVVTTYSSGQLIIFSGKRWKVVDVDERGKTIRLKPAKAGGVPKFDSQAIQIHARLRQKMRDVLSGDFVPRYCDEASIHSLTNARKYFVGSGIAETGFVREERSLYWAIWDSDAAISTMVLLLTTSGHEVIQVGNFLIAERENDADDILGALSELLSKATKESIASLLQPRPQGKFDRYLSDQILKESLVNDSLDLEAARKYVASLRSRL